MNEWVNFQKGWYNTSHYPVTYFVTERFSSIFPHFSKSPFFLSARRHHNKRLFDAGQKLLPLTGKFFFKPDLLTNSIWSAHAPALWPFTFSMTLHWFLGPIVFGDKSRFTVWPWHHVFPEKFESEELIPPPPHRFRQSRVLQTCRSRESWCNPCLPGCFVENRTRQAHSYLKAFALAVPCAWNMLPSDTHSAYLLQSLLQCHFLREDFLNHFSTLDL